MWDICRSVQKWGKDVQSALHCRIRQSTKPCIVRLLKRWSENFVLGRLVFRVCPHAGQRWAKITIFDLDLQDHYWWSWSFGGKRSPVVIFSNDLELWSLIFNFLRSLFTFTNCKLWVIWWLTRSLIYYMKALYESWNQRLRRACFERRNWSTLRFKLWNLKISFGDNATVLEFEVWLCWLNPSFCWYQNSVSIKICVRFYYWLWWKLIYKW